MRATCQARLVSRRRRSRPVPRLSLTFQRLSVLHAGADLERLPVAAEADAADDDPSPGRRAARRRHAVDPRAARGADKDTNEYNE